MSDEDRREKALAEIDRMEGLALVGTLRVRRFADGDDAPWPYWQDDAFELTDVLRGDREVLERHYFERYRSTGYPPAVYVGMTCWGCRSVTDPCPDAGRVLDRYAPED